MGRLRFQAPWTFAAKAEKQARMPVGIQVLKGTQEFEGGFEGTPYENPGDLEGQHGVEIYNTMINECDMCSAASSYLLLAALSTGWEIEAASEDPIDQKAADFQKWSLENVKGTTAQALLNILQGGPVGFSVGELVWGDILRKGDFKGKQPIAQIADKNPEYIEFKVDSFGQIADEGVWQRNYTGNSLYTKVDLEDVVYYAFWPRNDNPYGSPLLKPAYPWYFKKRFVRKQWGSFLERYGKPVPIGWVDPSTSDTDRAKFLTMIRNIRGNLAAILSNTLKLELQQIDMRPTTSYEDSILTCNRAIARSLLLPAMVMEKDATGSLALAKNQSETQFVWILRFFAQGLESVVNQQWIGKSHKLNFGDRAGQPKFKLKEYVQDDLVAKAQMYGTLSLIGLVFDIDLIREEFGIPRPKDDAVLVGGRPAGGGVLEEDGQIWGRVQATFPGATAKDVNSYTQMVMDAVNGKLKAAPPVYSFGAPPEGIEEHIKFDETNTEEDVAAGYWSEIGTQVIESMAEKAGAGKGNGGRRQV